jgi:asparagine synthase (glutamine-hydrolysing)
VCGITGQISFNEKVVQRNFIEQCCETIKHRGPDHTGIYVEDHVGLGMTRLSIIDLQNGNQPFFSENGEVVLVFNGEIYNFKELRSELNADFHFSTTSDTEVILNGYLKWGKEIFNKLNGMFAIAIWDKRSNKLILARDPIGIKPLYYSITENTLIFSSETKTFPMLGIANEISSLGLSQYLFSSYTFHPNTSIKGVQQLVQGNLLEVSLSGIVKIDSFAPTICQKKVINKTDTFQLDDLIKSLDESVARQTVSDVPFGLLLSAGVDSMHLLYSLIENNLADNLQTFTASFDNPSFSEDKLVREITNKLGIKNETIEITSRTVIEDFEKACLTFDNLEFLPTCMSIYHVSKIASREHKVVLAGNGGDELFYGYPTHKASKIHQQYNLFTKHSGQFKFLERILPNQNNYLGLKEKVHRFIEVSQYSPELAHTLWRFIFSRDEYESILLKDRFTLEEIMHDQTRYFDQAKNLYLNSEESLSFVDLNTWLVDCSLMMWDKAGMNSSLEIRVPLLDLEFVDFVQQIDSNLKTYKIGSKHLFREIGKKRFAPEIINKPKQGFQAPVHNWISEQSNFFKDYTYSLPGDIFNKKSIDKLWSESKDGIATSSLKLWQLSCLAGWSKGLNIKF